ncbi:YadA C-terminal domain-containing protein [Prochlorococcus marinus]|uniref:YadA C-terminal domain-containing protein n=1 Tax=Prochlorococcus marinus TaxID=1219 RepID=UPI000190098F|nr:YadA C-terminal domain-containing protein [Prochlorococcus marinus]EEE40239.1 conserved hypothetical protein [Prochlorococcus marinus str. MIT 9202]
MKKLFALSLIGSTLVLGSNPSKADWDYWAIDHHIQKGLKIYTYDAESNTHTLRSTKTFTIAPDVENATVNNFGELSIKAGNDNFTYNINTDVWTNFGVLSTWRDNYEWTSSKSIISKDTDGNIHIGENSLVIPDSHSTLSDGTKVQNLWGEDENDNKIPINIYGSKLLIDGVEVTAGGDSSQVSTNKNNISTNKANIKNIGEGVAGSTALTAALTALPQTSKESKLSCGVGSGAYSSRYAVSFGCASKVNERVDINAGGSYVFGGSKSYGEGTLDDGVIKAGFVFKLGELNKPTQISMRETKELKREINDLKENNKNIIAQNNALLARLERLEKVALGDLKSKVLAVYPLK